MKNAVRCLNCFVTIESKHTHDFKYCDCKHVFVDGGPEYRRRGWDGTPNWMEILDDGTEKHCLEMMEPPGPTHPAYPWKVVHQSATAVVGGGGGIHEIVYFTLEKTES